MANSLLVYVRVGQLITKYDDTYKEEKKEYEKELVKDYGNIHNGWGSTS